jgi:hypothetical protein
MARKLNSSPCVAYEKVGTVTRTTFRCTACGAGYVTHLTDTMRRGFGIEPCELCGDGKDVGTWEQPERRSA